jgi:hypothetical protein
VSATAVLKGGNTMPNRGEDELSFRSPAEATNGEARRKKNSSNRGPECFMA